MSLTARPEHYLTVRRGFGHDLSFTERGNETDIGHIVAEARRTIPACVRPRCLGSMGERAMLRLSDCRAAASMEHNP